MGQRRRHPVVLAAAALIVVIGLAVGAALFQPWQLFVNTTVDEARPGDSPTVTSGPLHKSTPSAGEPRPARQERSSQRQPTIEVLSTGNLISHEHRTSGKVLIVRLVDGRRVLRFEDLKTSSGPDLRIWLSAGPVVRGRGGWFLFGDYPYAELGRLKANQGNQNYVIPADIDLGQLTSVTIWCKRFRVSFGAAELA